MLGRSMATLAIMRSTSLSLVFSLALSGCASHCFDRDLYKPKTTSENQVKVSIEEFDLTIGAFIDLGGVASLRVSECGLEKDINPINPKKVCLAVRVDDSHTFQFSAATINVYSTPNAINALPMSDLEYRIFTSLKTDGSSVSDSSFTLPTDAVVKHREERYGTGKNDYYSFESTALFNGASSTFSPPVARAFSKDSSRRPYSSSVNLPPNLGKQFFVKLPNVMVDGKEYMLPILEFNYARESICYTAA